MLHKHQQSVYGIGYMDCQIGITSTGGAIGIPYGALKKEVRDMLTDKQEKFARAIALDGMNQSDAYRACYDTETENQKTVWDNASQLANSTEVAQRIAELRGETATPQIMNAIQRRETLTAIANNPEASLGDRMKAIDLLNKMDGEYVQKVQAEVKGETTINIELVDDDE